MKKLLQSTILYASQLLWMGNLFAQTGNHVLTASEAVNYDVINLTTPGGQTWSTDRVALPGYFSLFGNASFSNASDAANVNGYVKKYGNTAFTFPVGTGADLRTIAISAPAVSTEAYAAAWIGGNPRTTPDPTNANALHDTAAVAGTIKRVMPLGQWDWQAISGTGAGLTVTASIPNLSTFAPAGHLRLVGWDNAIAKWVPLSTATPTSNTENTLIAGTMQPGIDAVAVGSIADGFPELTPGFEIDNSTFTASQSRDFIINLFEIANNPSDGNNIQINLSVPSGWTISVPGITLTGTNQNGISGTSNVAGGTPNSNSNFLFRSSGSFVIVTIPGSQLVAANGSMQIGFTATRKATTTSNTSQNFTASISTGNRGGDLQTVNNVVTQSLTAN